IGIRFIDLLSGGSAFENTEIPNDVAFHSLQDEGGAALPYVRYQAIVRAASTFGDEADPDESLWRTPELAPDATHLSRERQDAFAHLRLPRACTRATSANFNYAREGLIDCHPPIKA